MQNASRTVVGIFSDIADARRATDELHMSGISTARLIENDQSLTFTGTAEREGAEPGAHYKGGGIRGFFARLFGYDDHRADWQLSSDTESFFQDAYNKKQQLIIIEDCANVGLCRDIIAAHSGTAEEKGGQYYQSEKDLQRNHTATSDREAFDSGGRSSIGRSENLGRDHDQAADSGLGVDVDRMPFAHRLAERSGDRALDGFSGDADRTPLVGQGAHQKSPDAVPPGPA